MASSPSTPIRLVPWTLALVLAGAGLWLARQNLDLRHDNSALRAERELAETARRMAENRLAERTLLAESIINDLGRRLANQLDLSHLEVSALTGGGPVLRAIVVWDPGRQSGLLTAEQMPAPAPGKDYQIWIVERESAERVSGGVFTVSADHRVLFAFQPDRPVEAASGFIVSLEKSDGVSKSEGPVVLSGP